MLVKDRGLPGEMIMHKNGAQICDPKRPTTFAMAGPGRRRVEFMRLPTETKEEFFTEAKANIYKILFEFLDSFRSGTQCTDSLLFITGILGFS